MSNSANTGGNSNPSDETKIIYHIDEEETPYLIKLNVSPDKVTLGDFRNALNRPHYKYFFKSMDDDFGVVKEEISDDNVRLPCFNGRVISWLVTAEGSTVSDGIDINQNDSNHLKDNRINDNRPAFSESHFNTTLTLSNNNNNSTDTKTISTTGATALATHSKIISNNHNKSSNTNESDTLCDTCTETDSVYSAAQDRVAPLRSFHDYKHAGRINAHHNRLNNTPNGANPIYETNSSMMSSDLESTSFFDSEDESTRLSTTTGTTKSSRYGRQRQPRRRKRPPVISRASSFSSITDSTMSLNIISVRLSMDTVKFLGISIVGQSNKGGDGGIYVGSIMKGGAVAQDGRIEPGDMILEVNDISFEDMSNDDAVRTLREEVTKAGPITLVVAKCWDPNPKGYFTIPRQEPVRPIDPRAWVLHTNAMTAQPGQQQPGAVSVVSTGDVLPGNGATGTSGAVAMAAPSMQSLLSGGTMLAGTSAATFNAAHGFNPQPTSQNQSLQPPPPPPSALIPNNSNGGGPIPPPPYSTQLINPHHPQQPSQQQQQQQQHQFAHSAASIVTTSSSLPESERYQEELRLTINTDIGIVVRTMAQPDSGLDIRDRLWLKITLPNAFIGSDLVDWLYRHVEGFSDRKEARKYAATLLKFGYIRHTVNKLTFSEQCYYVLGEGVGVSRLSLDHVDSVSEAGAIGGNHQISNGAVRHLAALPPPNWSSAGSSVPMGAPPNQSISGVGQPPNHIAPPPLPPNPNDLMIKTGIPQSQQMISPPPTTASSNSQYSVVGPPPTNMIITPVTSSSNNTSATPNTIAATTNKMPNNTNSTTNQLSDDSSSSSGSSSSSTDSDDDDDDGGGVIGGCGGGMGPGVLNNTVGVAPAPPPRTLNNNSGSINATSHSSIINTTSSVNNSSYPGRATGQSSSVGQ